MLRARLVCGVNDDRMQRDPYWLEVDLNFDKALHVCQAMEPANKIVRDLQGLSVDEQTQIIRTQKGLLGRQKRTE